MAKDMVSLAEQYCLHFHHSQTRKGGNREPYATHPFSVRDILIKYGYDDPETQSIALLHDTVEDTVLKYFKREIERRFGMLVYEGVYMLSRNTPGKNAKKLSPLFKNLGVHLVGEDGLLTPEAYKVRLLFSRDNIKRVKIADMINNTKDLPSLNPSGIERKIKDSETFYIPLGEAVAPLMVDELVFNIANYKQSEHYKKHFLI